MAENVDNEPENGGIEPAWELNKGILILFDSKVNKSVLSGICFHSETAVCAVYEYYEFFNCLLMIQHSVLSNHYSILCHKKYIVSQR